MRPFDVKIAVKIENVKCNLDSITLLVLKSICQKAFIQENQTSELGYSRHFTSYNLPVKMHISYFSYTCQIHIMLIIICSPILCQYCSDGGPIR